MGQTYWKCASEDCSDDSIYRFKGLCRDCTTYTDGKVTVAVQKVRCNADGSNYIAPPSEQWYKPMTRKEQIEISRRHKYEKKHKNAMRKAKRMLREESIPEEHREALEALVAEQIGESVPECCSQETCSHREEEE